MPAISSVRVADLDDDGDLDLIGSAFDRGELAWWEVSSFRTGGQLQSSVLDLGEAPDQANLDWVASVPTSTTLAVETRSADDVVDLGDWSAGEEPGALPDPVGRFVLTRVGLTSADGLRSPVLEEVALSTVEAPDCDPDSTTLCLNRGRFRVEVVWQDSGGGSGQGRVVACGSADSGLLWFFSPDNWGCWSRCSTVAESTAATGCSPPPRPTLVTP